MNRHVKEHNGKSASRLLTLALALLSTCPGAALAQNVACPVNTSCDPGPRPVGNQSAPFPGPENTNKVFLLPVPVIDTFQPNDANGNEGAGAPINNSGNAGAFWANAGAVFGQVATVNGAKQASGNPTLLGLGPAFNGNSCLMCHSQPTIGGSSPGKGTPGFTQNPQLTVATLNGATNPEVLTPIVTANGPVREVRYILSETDPSRLTLDGGVHDLFSIQGRNDAPKGCVLSQPDVTTQLANRNASFRIPTPTFGLGLVENISNQDLIANAALEAGLGFGVQNGVLNLSPNDGSISRFGWKAQNKSLYLFAGEASNVELGITNELFPNERTPGTNCTGNPLPEDDSHVSFQTGLTEPDVDSFVSSAIENFAEFMRLNGAPAQCDFASGVDSTGAAVCKTLSASATRGQTLFDSIGCNACHTPSFTTQPSNVPGMSNRTFHPYSDFALHHMGSTLADGVTQGAAGPDQFRTAPLWGVGQRLFLLHDGRTSDLKQAILFHASGTVGYNVTPLTTTSSIDSVATSTSASNMSAVNSANGTAANTNPAGAAGDAGSSGTAPVGGGFNSCYLAAAVQVFTVTFPLDNNASASFFPISANVSCGSEANQVIASFQALTVAQQQDLLNFLRSL